MPAPPPEPTVQKIEPAAPDVRRADTWLHSFVRLLRGRTGATVAPLAVPSVADPPVEIDTPPPVEAVDDPIGESALQRGLHDIRRTDPGFDPSRFAGYAGMIFRDTQSAWMARDFGSVRERVTAEMHRALQMQCARLKGARHVNRVAEVEITAVVTEAWQEDGRDYMTAHVEGSMIDYTVDEVTDRLVVGSRTMPRAVDEFWTFVRPAGLNFWMLSAIELEPSAAIP